ncbi:CATRA conflict system CASPASE/TPR repeat-associated protein [Actinomadura welshii]
MPAERGLIVHLFARVEGARADGAVRALRDVWRACADALGMTEAVPRTGLPREFPAEPLAPVPTGPVAAIRSDPAHGGLRQALLTRDHDAWILSVSLDADPADGPDGWKALHRTWLSTVGAAPGAVLDDLLGAVYVHWAATDTASARLRESVRRAAPDVPAAPGWHEQGEETPDGWTLWEISPRVDTRAERHFAAVAPAGRKAALRQSVWMVGGPAPAPLVRYLLHAARMRYQLRVWEDGHGFGRLRERSEETLEYVLPLVTGPADDDRLAEADRRLTLLQADEAGLAEVLAGLRTMRRNVQVAAANMAAWAGTAGDAAHPHGPFHDDRSLADWFDRHLEDDEAYLTVTRDRVHEVGAIADRLLRRRLHEREEAGRRRHEMFTLLQTAVVSTLLMALAAIQSLGYKVPVPGPVKPPVVLLLGAIVLGTSAIGARLALPGHGRAAALLENTGIGLAAASLLWLLLAALSPPLLGELAAPAVTWATAGAGFVIGTVLATRLRRGRAP